MTIGNNYNRAVADGNGVTTTFNFSGYFLEDTDLVVIIRNELTGVETVKTLITHYTASGAGNPLGGSITLTVAPTTDEQVIIYRDPALEQPLNLADNDSMPAEEVEKAFDRVTMIAQRLSEQIERSIRVSEGTIGFDPTLPSPILPGVTIQVNEDGTGFVNGPTGQDLADAEENADAAEAAATTAANAMVAAEAAVTDAEAAVADAEAAATAAGTSATAAATSATAAATSATGASNSATAAATSASNTAAAVATHAALTSTHGVAGALVGTSDAQVLTNKDIDGGVAANTRRITVPGAALATLNGLTRKAGTLLYETGAKLLYWDTGTELKRIMSPGIGKYVSFSGNGATNTGSTSTKVRRLGNVSNSGYYTVTDSALHGTIIQPTEDGTYAIVYGDGSTTAATFIGIYIAPPGSSLTVVATTNIQDMNPAYSDGVSGGRLVYTVAPFADYSSVSAIVGLAAGSLIRPMWGSGGAAPDSSKAHLRIVKLFDAIV